MTPQENSETTESFSEQLRKEALSGNFGPEAILHEMRKAESEYEEFRDSESCLPQDIEIIQSLLRFAADQPSPAFLVPYIKGNKSDQEIKKALELLLFRNLEESHLSNRRHEAAISLYQYELARNASHQAEIEVLIAKNYPTLESFRRFHP